MAYLLNDDGDDRVEIQDLQWATDGKSCNFVRAGGFASNVFGFLLVEDSGLKTHVWYKRERGGRCFAEPRVGRGVGRP